MIPVAVVTGPVGVGKSTVLREMDALLIAAGVSHASIELEDVARFWGPRPAEGGTRPDVAYGNLAAVCANYVRAGADRLVLSLLMERRSDLRPVSAAIPGAEIKVVRLHAAPSVIEARVRRRELVIPEQELSAARWWVARLRRARFADHVVDNGRRPPSEVAAEVLRVLGWPGSAD